MKKILLASVALTAFAGAAAAEVTFSGSATLGYNEDDGFLAADARVGDFKGFYTDGDIKVGLSEQLDNGLTAAVSFGIDFSGDAGTGPLNANGDVLSSADVVISLSSDVASLSFGATTFAAEDLWSAAGDMENDGFSEADGETVLKGTMSYGSVNLAVSGVAADADGDAATDDLAQMSAAVTADLGSFTLGAAYQEAATVDVDFAATTAGFGNADFNGAEIFGIFAKTSVAGADLTVAYASNETADLQSTGIKVAYPMGDVKVTAYYVADESATDTDDNYGVNVAYAAGAVAVALDYQDDQGVTKVGLDGSYDMGNGLKLLAGVYDQDGNTTAANDGTDYYVAAEYELGGGASLLVSYADAESASTIGDDEVGAPDYQVGTTVAVTFAF